MTCLFIFYNFIMDATFVRDSSASSRVKKRVLIRYYFSSLFIMFIVLTIWLFYTNDAVAHHILGRPSYELNENSNTPPTLQGETKMGGFYIAYMVYPAFPKPEEPGRISIYIKSIKNDQLFNGTVNFSVRHDKLFSFSRFDTIGTQHLDDNVYRQSFNFHQAGEYVVRARFRARDEDYRLDIPLRVGPVAFTSPIGLTVGAFVALLIFVGTVRYYRSMI